MVRGFRFVFGPVSQVLAIWELAIPLPAVMLITVSLYILLLGIGLWIRYCLKVGAASLVIITKQRVVFSYFTF